MKVGTVDPKVQLVFVTRIEVVVDCSLAFATKPPVADKKITARAQPHENVIVKVSVGNDVFQTKLESWFMVESLLIRFVVNRLIEKSSR